MRRVAYRSCHVLFSAYFIQIHRHFGIFPFQRFVFVFWESYCCLLYLNFLGRKLKLNKIDRDQLKMKYFERFGVLTKTARVKLSRNFAFRTFRWQFDERKHNCLATSSEAVVFLTITIKLVSSNGEKTFACSVTSDSLVNSKAAYT